MGFPLRAILSCFFVGLALSFDSLDLETCDSDCALSLRQLRGQQHEAQVAQHGEGLHTDPEPTETAAADTQGEGTEDPYSKAPADTAEAETADAKPPADVEPPAATKSKPEEPQTEAKPTPGEGTEDPYSKAPADAETPAETETPAAAETPAETETPAAKTPAATEAPAEETPAETETPAAKTPAATEAPAEETPAETETPAAETPAETEKPAAEETATAETPEEKPADAEESEESTMTQELWEAKQGGLCCFTGSDYDDTCGSCYPTAVASFKSPCAKNGDKCMTCGGSWCQPKCVIGAADPNNMCKTAFDTGIADSKRICASNSSSCASCKGEWCRLGVTKVAGGAGVVNSGSGQAASATAAINTGGFCCYRGNVFAKDMCTACEDVSQDIACANSKGCGACGGTWCAGPRCVKAFSDTKDPCHSAYKGNVAPVSDYWAKTEERCTDCGGAWCSANDITFDDGDKFDPDATEDSGAESESESDDDEDEDDAPSFEPLDDLLPHGLAKKA